MLDVLHDLARAPGSPQVLSHPLFHPFFHPFFVSLCGRCVVSVDVVSVDVCESGVVVVSLCGVVWCGAVCVECGGWLRVVFVLLVFFRCVEEEKREEEKSPFVHRLSCHKMCVLMRLTHTCRVFLLNRSVRFRKGPIR